MAGDKTDLLYNAYFTSTLADQGVHYGYQITHGCIMLRYCNANWAFLVCYKQKNPYSLIDCKLPILTEKIH